MGILVSAAWMTMTLVYVVNLFVRLKSPSQQKKPRRIVMFGLLLFYYIGLPSLALELVTEFHGDPVRVILLFAPMGLLAIDLATWFKPRLLGIWTIGIAEKLSLSLLYKDDRRTCRAITRWQRQWRKYFWRWVFIGPPFVVLAGYFEWLILHSSLDAWW